MNAGKYMLLKCAAAVLLFGSMGRSAHAAEKKDCINERGATPKIAGRYVGKSLSACFDQEGWIYSKKFKWIMVNPKGQIVLWGVATMDNGPDYFQDGLVRVERRKKWGFADSSGNLKIKPLYDGAQPFEKGVAFVCNGCKSIPDGEYHRWDGGETLYVDTNGNRVPEPR